MLLKRGLSATMEEFLLAAEYILNTGNPQRDALRARHPHLRGLRRFTLPLATVPYLHEKTHLPVVVDPSHGTGKAHLVPAMAGPPWPPGPTA